MTGTHGVIAAGHPVTARAGADVLLAGGNAVDAAIAAMLVSCVAEPLLTGFGAGGYMLVALPGADPVLIDFFVAAPGLGGTATPGPLLAVEVSFGAATQVFHVGAASVGAYGVPAGVCHAALRFGSLPLAELIGPAALLARDGVPFNGQQAYVATILEGIVRSSPGMEELFAPTSAVLREGEVFRNRELAVMLELLGAQGAKPFYHGEIAQMAVDVLAEQGGTLTLEDLANYRAQERVPVSVAYRGREVLTNPPPSAGGTLIAYALGLIEGTRPAGAPTPGEMISAMEQAQSQRTPEFLAGLEQAGFLESFLASRLGSTTHIAVLDSQGGACSVTCSNGEGSGVIVPGTGIQLNNMMGEEDLNPMGFHLHPPGRRMPSMMAPTIVLRDGAPEIVLGSAGSNRIRSALTQTIVNVVDRRMTAADAVNAPRIHVEDDVVFAEPGADLSKLDRPITRFQERNLFFGGVQAVVRSADGAVSAAGDPRRGGAAIVL